MLRVLLLVYLVGGSTNCDTSLFVVYVPDVVLLALVSYIDHAIEGGFALNAVTTIDFVTSGGLVSLCALCCICCCIR